VIHGLDHVQLAMPAGSEDPARRFYVDVLGLIEVPKPPALTGRGGCWFQLPDGRQLHLGVDAGFTAARKAHPALRTPLLDDLAARLTAAGFPVTWDTELAPARRFYTADAFGNRLELVEASLYNPQDDPTVTCR
jgi:catechol 2,3-dioxygenase-like lactoylglutathione lyase family enzyme